MRELIPGKLWTGNAVEARNPSLLHDLSVRFVVDLAVEEPPAVLPREVAYLRCPIEDGDTVARDILQLAILVAERLVRTEAPTLIACSAGLSRSVAVAAAALSLAKDQPLDTGFECASRFGPTDVSPGIARAVALICDEMAG